MKNPLDSLQELFLQVFAKPGNSDPDNALILEWYLEEYYKELNRQEKEAKNVDERTI